MTDAQHEVNFDIDTLADTRCHAADMWVSNGIGRVAKLALELSYMRPTSSRPGGTVPKCNDERSSAKSRWYSADLVEAKGPTHDLVADDWQLNDGQETGSDPATIEFPLKEHTSPRKAGFFIVSHVSWADGTCFIGQVFN